MRLLFDENLSPRLVERLDALFPGAIHVSFVSLDRASDEAVWNYAQTNDCIIVTKDSDFHDMSVLRGFPPKVIWLRLGDCTTRQVEAILRANHEAIQAFVRDAIAGTLVFS